MTIPPQSNNFVMRASNFTTRMSHNGFRAFSLVEMLIVIAIIAVLAALTATVGVHFKEKAEIDEVTNLLKKLEVILQEWETRSGRDLMWGTDGDPTLTASYDLQINTPHVFGITELLKTVGKPRQIKDMIGQIKPAFIYKYDKTNIPQSPIWVRAISADDPDPNTGQVQVFYDNTGNEPKKLEDGDLAILDVWGVPIRIIHPGRVWIDGTDIPNDRNDDGTLYTSQEKSYGIAAGRRICFVSAGPDGKFGDFTQPANSDIYKQAADNIYSYEVQKP